MQLSDGPVAGPIRYLSAHIDERAAFVVVLNLDRGVALKEPAQVIGCGALYRLEAEGEFFVATNRQFRGDAADFLHVVDDLVHAVSPLLSGAALAGMPPRITPGHHAIRLLPAQCGLRLRRDASSIVCLPIATPCSQARHSIAPDLSSGVGGYHQGLVTAMQSSACSMVFQVV